MPRIVSNRRHDASKLFFCLPFGHSENSVDQELSVVFNTRLGQPWLTHAEGCRNIIRRFGRSPHRNIMLGRRTTSEDQAFLDEGSLVA